MNTIGDLFEQAKKILTEFQLQMEDEKEVVEYLPEGMADISVEFPQEDLPWQLVNGDPTLHPSLWRLEEYRGKLGVTFKRDKKRFMPDTFDAYLLELDDSVLMNRRLYLSRISKADKKFKEILLADGFKKWGQRYLKALPSPLLKRQR